MPHRQCRDGQVNRAHARDRPLPAVQRRLFPFVEITYEPETVDGFLVAEAADAIKKNIQYLHWRVLGEELNLGDPELEATYNFFVETWREGKAGIADGTEVLQLPWWCRARTDFWTQALLPDDLMVSRDEQFTIRAWMATMSLLLSDYRFLYE